MRSCFTIAVLALAILPSRLCLAQLAVEDFESGSSNGWTFYGDASQFQWNGAEGNPAGCLRAVDLNTGIVWGFTSGPAFAGDFSAAYGGTLEWDVRTTHPGTASGGEPDVRIVGASLTLVMDLPAISTTSWVSRSVALTETAGWKKGTITGAVPTQAEMQSVLSNVVSFQFRPEYSNSVDTGRIDNVALHAPCVLQADLDANGMVELSDLTVLLANFGTPSGATFAQGDVDGNGAIDLGDLTVLLANFGTSCL